VLTIFFSDIAGYTRIAEATPPDRLVPRLGAYFDLVERTIVESGGIVDKFMGDGIIAFFNAPRPVAGHEARASEAAAEVQRRLAAFDRQGAAEGWPPFTTRIGLACGEVLVGNIGTPRRLSYTAIGDAVNLASRLEALNKVYGTAVLAAGEVRQAAARGLEWRHLDRVTVPGRQEPLELHELLGRTGEVAADRLLVRDLHEAALAAHLAGDFDAAERGFLAILEASPGDRAAGILLDHTIEARTQQARKGRRGRWTGVHAYPTKQ
jgi:adenylate cyclase